MSRWESAGNLQKGAIGKNSCAEVGYVGLFILTYTSLDSIVIINILLYVHASSSTLVSSILVLYNAAYSLVQIQSNFVPHK